jgi:hypothetical protein
VPGRIEIRTFEDDDWPEFLPILQEVARAGETYAMPSDIAEAEAREFWTGDHVVTARQGSTLLGGAKMGANRPAQGAHVGTANTAAVRLWESLGFTIIGTVPEAFRRPSGEYVGLHVMHLPLQG